MIFSILILLVCILLVLVILVQNSKGGGIQSQFGAATQIMGVKRGTEFIEKATWGLAVTLIVLSVLMTPKNSLVSSDEDSVSTAKRRSQNAVAVPQQQQQQQQQQAPAQQPAPPTQPQQGGR